MTAPRSLSFALLLSCAAAASAQDGPRRGLAAALDPDTRGGVTRAAATPGGAPAARPGAGVTDARAARRAAVDDAIRAAEALVAQGRTQEALEVMRQAVRGSDFKDAKARYFLAKMYSRRATELARAGDARGAREMGASMLQHLRGARDLKDGDNAEWAAHARDRLHARAASAPRLGQYTEGGSYPGGYCGPTVLRMALRHEGLPDPGADAVALQGARPYSPGAGTDGAALAKRARELGLSNASFTKAGTLERVVRSLDGGTPVLMAGEREFTATLDDGTLKARSYDAGHYLLATGYERDARGRVSLLRFNDPDTGRRVSMGIEAARTFFGQDRTMWIMTYDGNGAR